MSQLHKYTTKYSAKTHSNVTKSTGATINCKSAYVSAYYTY